MSTISHEEIERRERALLEDLPIDAEHVPDAEENGFDARVRSRFVATNSLGVVGRLYIDAGTPLELKTCQVWIDDSGSRNDRRRGTFRIQEDTHERLEELGGVYCLLVMDADEVLTGRIVEPEHIEARVSSWTNGGRKYQSRRAHISWAKLIPTERVEGGGVCQMMEVSDAPE